jgi:membrane-bound lytic murein transglycosylase D
LPEVARHFGLELEILRRLNPALRSSVIRGKKYIPKGFFLRLPLNQDSDMANRMAELPDELYRSFPRAGGTYTVRRGDTVGEIAKMYGIQARDLIAVNDLNTRATIYVNQKLEIPSNAKPATLVASVASSHSNKKKAATSLPAISGEKNAANASGSVHAPSESLAVAKAEKAGSSPLPADEAERQSDLAPVTDLWLARAVPTQPLESPDIDEAYVAVEKISLHGGKPVGIIQVEVEETLGHYAEWLEISAREIRRLNGIRYGVFVHINQKIKIPFNRVTKAEFEEKRLEYHKQIAEDFFAAYRVEKVIPYVIKKGDNIWNLSREQFEVPVWLIKRYNSKVDFGALTPSQKLLIPIVEKNV